MNYVGYNTFIQDIKGFASTMPRKYYDAIIAIPRSGLMPSAIIAFELDVPVFTPNELLNNNYFNSNRMGLKEHDIKCVLVIDDTVCSGKTLDKVQNILKDISNIKVEYGAIYVTESSLTRVHRCHKILSLPRLFEWNIMNCAYLKHAAVDIDGVLCKDPDFIEVTTIDGVEKIRKHILNAEPQYIIRYPILALVTNRLEKYREETENWLKKHNIRYKYLIMSSYKNAEERRQAGKHGEYKANAMIRVGAKYFIESSAAQAEVIHKRTKRPVFCVDTKQMYG
jgi:uncharacterized HAD superfamily protein